MTSTISSYAQYKPTLIELSGNGPTVDQRGYVYNFKGGRLENCYNPITGLNQVYNQLGSTNYSYELDPVNGYFNMLCNGKQTKTEAVYNHFTADNCFNIERSKKGYVNFSNENDRGIEIRVRSSVAVEKFGAYIVAMDDENTGHLGDGAEHESKALPAGKWKTIKTTALFTTWDEKEMNPAKVVGIALYARNGEDPQPIGTIEIDYIKVGSAVRSFASSGEPTVSLQGYQFSFDSDAAHVCSSPINTTGNRNFKLSYDAIHHTTLLTQKIVGNRYEVFAMEFTDRDCFLQHITLSKEKQFIEIRVKPDHDVPSFSMTVCGDLKENKLWDYGKVQKYETLKGGEWNIVKLPLSLKSQTDGELDDQFVRGVVLVFNPMSLNEKLKNESVTYEIDYIKVVDAVVEVSNK